MIGALVAGITGSGGASLSSYESIATAVGTGSSDTITFSSIPSGFKHLQIRGIAYDGAGNQIYIRANGDTGSNYTRHTLAGDGTTATATGLASAAQINTAVPAGSTTSTMSALVIDLLDYGSTSKYKTFRGLGGYDANGSGSIRVFSGLWMSTSAVTSISLINSGASWATSTTFALYGIKEA